VPNSRIAFWRDEFARLIGASLVRQIQLASNPQQTWMVPLLADTLSTIGTVAVDDGFLKSLNVDLLMKTREDAARTRICALECVGKLWSTNGRRLAGWKHETLPFLHECAEDENEDVVAEARKLKGILDQF
jgi:U3 small nucleolar RNA-associated protein 10